MQPGDTIEFEGPFGRFTLRDGERPILLVAGATGFAPIKSILEDAFRRGVRRPIWLYWGVRQRADLYAMELAERWQREHDNFHFVPVLSHADAEDHWTGPVGLVRHNVLRDVYLKDHPAPEDIEYYLCGPGVMNNAVIKLAMDFGVDRENIMLDDFGL